ncbi:hypothetical protein GYMLUDRAFT_56255 [Collybiopsis luxurians FD-317 M1]|nr:hypothetical protein GYMLUDRAFT_56255 [Collybiopsis luxurians FD-317 M1]
MSSQDVYKNPDSHHMSNQQGSASEPRPALQRNDTEQLLSYYQSPLADSPYKDTRRPPPLSRQLSSSSTSESDYSASSHSDYSNSAAPKRSTLPSEGSSDRRRMAIVEMDSVVETAKKHGRRGKKDSFGSLALVAPPDASPKSYNLTSSPTAVPEGEHATNSVDSSGGDETRSHHRSQSEVSSPRKSPRDVGIIGTARQPIVLDLETVNESGHALHPPIFIQPQSRSPGPSSPAVSPSPSSLLPPMKRRSTGQSIVVVTPDIGTSKPIDAPVAGPVVVDLNVVQTASLEASPSMSQQATPSYLDYKPGVHATAGPLPPPPRAAITLDSQSPAPPRPPRLNSPMPQQTSHAPLSNSKSANTSSRRGDIDIMRQALQLPPSVTKALAARPLTPSRPPMTKADVPSNVSENPSLTSLSSSLNHSPVEATRSTHRREGAFSPSSIDTSPQSVTINVSKAEPESDKPDVIVSPSLRRVDTHLQPTHEELVEKGPPITEVHPLKPPSAFATSAASSSSSFGTVQPLGLLGSEAGESGVNARQDHTWVEVRTAETSPSPSPSPSPIPSPEHPRMSAEHSHHARTIVSHSTSNSLSVDGHATPSRSSSVSPAISRSHSPSGPAQPNSRSPSLSPAPSPPPKSFRHSITNGLKRMSLPRSPSAKSLSRGSYERERSSYEDEPSGHPLPNIPQAQLVNFQSPVPLRDIQPYQEVHRPYLRPLQPTKRKRKINSNPAAMFCSEVTAKRSAGERCMLYAQKINELWTYDCGLADWMEEMRDRGSGSASRGAAISLIQSPPTSPISSSFHPTSPSTIPFTSQPRQISQSSYGSVITEATFPRRPDASAATDLSFTTKEASSLAPPTGPPPLPYPSLATASQRYPGKSNFSSGNSSGSESPAKGYKALMSPLTPTSKTGAFFASLGRKASVTRKDRGLGSAAQGPTSARLTKLPKNGQNSQPPSTAPAASPSVPGGPRAPPNRMLKSQTMIISPMVLDNSSSSSSGGQTSALGRRPSLYDIPSGDSIHHSTSTSLHGHFSKPTVRGGPRSQSSSPSKAPSRTAHTSSPQPESSWEPEFKRQVDGLSDLMPHADRTVLAGYLRRAGQDILAIGQYLEDERNGCLRRD